MKKSTWLIFALLVILPASFVFAKGNFDYITIKGPGITGEINVTDSSLTTSFFAFANFSQGAIDPPADPGEGYQIVRVFVITENEKPSPTPFDQLHYYPYTGFVYYDGVVSGEPSEYDGKWYAAAPSAEEPFRAALEQRARLTWYPFVVLIVLLGVFFFMYRKK